VKPPADPPEGFEPYVTRGQWGLNIGELWQKATEAGFVRAVRIDERHLNAAHIAHGGFLCTYMDSTLAKAIQHDCAGRTGFTVRMTTDFISPARRGDWLEGRARVTRETRQLAFVEGELSVGGRRVMTASGVFRLHDAERSARLNRG